MPQPGKDAALQRPSFSPPAPLSHSDHECCRRPGLTVYARRTLAAEPTGHASAVLLEGAWDESASAERESLDQTLDGRFDWLDRQAEACAAAAIQHDEARTACGQSPLWLGALELRYQLVRLLRVCAFFQHVRPLARGEQVQLVVELPRDEDYVDLMGQLCTAASAELTVRERPGAGPRGPQFPPNATLRRWLGAVAERVQPRPERRPGQLQVVLCGNPRVLEPLVPTLLARGVGLWWLYDRFALHAFLRWRWRGVGQLVCNTSQAQHNSLRAAVPEQLDGLGVNLAPAVRRHAERWLQGHGARQSALATTIAEHFQRLRPRALVLDEDATPLARAAIAAARAVGTRSLVIQHGAPCCRFGFAPLAADAICVWGRSTRSQLLRWGVPDEQILVTGSPYHDQLRARMPTSLRVRAKSAVGYRFLLLASVAPRDERPDALALHLTRQSYAGLIRAALDGALAAGCRELVVKLHPRAGRDPILEAALAERPALSVRVVRRVPLEQLLREVDCVLSCGSSAGVDATLTGVPVIQLLPAGASDFLSREPWGLAGSVRTADELAQLARQVLSPTARRPARDPNVFGDFARSAAARIADEILSPRPSGCAVPEPHSALLLQPSSLP